jgi:hypothetical protein
MTPRIIDITGHRFETWTVIRLSDRRDHKKAHWECRCDCGSEKVMESGRLRNGKWLGCKCSRKYPNLSGRKFGSLTAISRAEPRKNGASYWLCHCDCGTKKEISANSLIMAKSASCGCRIENDGTRRWMHGKTNHPLYKLWSSMHQRCDNPNRDVYALYGERGIEVCDRWRSFEAFLDDMGHRPSPDHTIDRIDNNGDYEPGNCRWATLVEQASNTRASKIWIVDGIEYPSARTAAQVFGVSIPTIQKWCEGKQYKTSFTNPRENCRSIRKYT